MILLIGNWTMVYDKGMIIESPLYSMFIFFKCTVMSGSSRTDSGKDLIALYHDKNTRQIGCFYRIEIETSKLISRFSKSQVVLGILNVAIKITGESAFESATSFA